MRRNRLPVSSRSSVLMPATGSSSSSTSAFWTSSMPISSHCFCPWASTPAGLSARWVSPMVCIACSIAGSTPGRRRSRVHTDRSAPAAMSRFCSTVSCSNTLAVWKVRPTPRRAIWCTFFPSSSTPDLFTDPDAGTSPVIASITVVFPAPLGPIRNLRSPWNRVRSTSLTALNPSKSTVKPRTSRYWVPIPALPPSTGSLPAMLASASVMSWRPPSLRRCRSQGPSPAPVRLWPCGGASAIPPVRPGLRGRSRRRR